jgi:hypothetical protein
MLRVVVIGHNEALYKEANAAEAITPGHLIALNSSGNAIKHATAGPAAAAGANAQGLVRVAVEQDFFGKGIDDAYAANDQVIYQTTITANAIGRACEAVDNSGGGSAARIRIEVL